MGTALGFSARERSIHQLKVGCFSFITIGTSGKTDVDVEMVSGRENVV
jgi:hypothetical protein